MLSSSHPLRDLFVAETMALHSLPLITVLFPTFPYSGFFFPLFQKTFEFLTMIFIYPVLLCLLILPTKWDLKFVRLGFFYSVELGLCGTRGRHQVNFDLTPSRPSLQPGQFQDCSRIWTSFCK